MSSDDALIAYVGRQRWYAGDAFSLRMVERTTLPWLSEPSTGLGVRVELLRLGSDDGGGGATQVYDVPLAYRSVPHTDLDHAYVDTLDDPAAVGIDGVEGPLYVYDALHDREAALVLMAGFTGDGPGTAGGLAYHHRPADEALDVIRPDARVVPLMAEQSNTSVIVDDELMLKVFRRLAPGRNPDIEVLERIGPTHADSVTATHGHLEVDVDGESYDLGVLLAFLRTATDGWDAARTSVRDLLADVDMQPSDAGGDWAAEAERLGATTRHVHEALAAHFETRPWGSDDLTALAARLTARWDAAVAVVPQLTAHSPAAHAVLGAVAELPAGVAAQRVHGDLHLGQALRTSKRWAIIDFEGEPGRPIHERTALDHPLRDVAGMLRSLDYAANSVLLQLGYALDTDDPATAHAAAWVSRNREAFLTGYAGYAAFTGDATDASPDGTSAAPAASTGPEAVLLRAYELDKAAYEVVYEAQNRPTWLPIPLSAVARLLG